MTLLAAQPPAGGLPGHGLWHSAGRHGIIGLRLRDRCHGLEHLRGEVFSWPRRPGRALPQRFARRRHRPGAAPGRYLRWPGGMVASAVDGCFPTGGTAFFSARTPLEAPAGDAAGSVRSQALCHRGFWLFAAAVLLYGIAETLCGNWSGSYLTGIAASPPEGHPSHSRASGRW